ncbi:MAG: ABC transporter permease [Caldilineaceae bacterium]|nr:ABC transporter permease [Caldilineaceae bacterium]
MTRLRLFFDLCRLTLQRLANRPMLTLLALIGIVLAVGLLTSAGFFSQAVDRVILQQELDTLSRSTGRIPFSMRVYFQPSSRKPVSLIDAENVGQSIGDTLAAEIGLPLDHLGLQVESGGLMLVPMPDDARYGSARSFLNTVNVVYVADVADHLEVISGEPMGRYDPVDAETLDVWMHTRLAEEMGIRVGERYQVTVNLRTAPRKIYIRGLWQAKDPTNSFWFSNPDTALRTGLLVTRTGYLQFMDPMLPAKSGFVNWHLILNDQPLNPKYATSYAIGFEQGMTVVNRYLPGARLDISPLDPLKKFVQRQSQLTLVLLGFNIPALAFLLYFLIQISLIIVRWQQRETALLVSRGMNLSSILGLTLLEEFLLFLVGIPLGIGFGMLLARWMGFTISFLAFVDRPPLPVSLQGIDFTLIGIALGVALLARLGPTLQATRQSVVEQAREGTRPLRAPFWQRVYLDFVLILPTYYVYQQLVARGTLAASATAARSPFGITSPDESAAQLFQDPLLVLAPALFILCVTLLSMRIFPWLLSFFDLIAARTPWLTLHLALRQLGRSSQSYVNPLLLVIVALAMGVYTRSMAESLDQWLIDQIYYHIGADVSFLPLVESSSGSDSAGPSDSGLRTEGLIPPKDTFAALPGVEAATRVGDYQARITGPNGEIRGRMLALDRVDFSQVAWFRDDFADEPLGALMNRLALAPENVLVTQAFVNALVLRIGDQFQMSVRLADGIAYTGAFRVAGIYRHFPTVETDDVVVIGNLEHLYTQSGAEFEHFIWLRTQMETNGTELFRKVQGTGVEPTWPRDARAAIAIDQAKMERVGIFGTLSIGFLAATVMAMLALLVHNYASLQERLYQFGVMRAIGLWRGQVLVQVVLEYGMLTIYGAVVGSLIGLYTAQFFAPFFRIPEGAGAPLPPLLPIIAEDATMTLGLIFAGLMILSELLVMTRALSMRLFTTLRMGHQG